MARRLAQWTLMFLCLSPALLRAQEFKLFDRSVQVHGWLSQGFVYTDSNNWLTMNTSSGSGAMTDMGVNLSTRVTDNFRVGAQLYDRNLGQLGQWHPSLDWAVADYRFTSWFGVRAGKVKTVLGLFNDTQDEDFLHSFPCCRKAFTRPTFAMPPSRIWAAIFTAAFPCGVNSATSLTRRMPATAATVSIAATLI